MKKNPYVIETAGSSHTRKIAKALAESEKEFRRVMDLTIFGTREEIEREFQRVCREYEERGWE
jgi:hypothetical protein